MVVLGRGFYFRLVFEARLWLKKNVYLYIWSKLICFQLSTKISKYKLISIKIFNMSNICYVVLIRTVFRLFKRYGRKIQTWLKAMFNFELTWYGRCHMNWYSYKMSKWACTHTIPLGIILWKHVDMFCIDHIDIYTNVEGFFLSTPIPADWWLCEM